MHSKPIKILLIEDSLEDFVIIREMLRDTNNPFQLEHADKLKVGFEKLFNESFNLILLDLNLPDSYGFDTFIRTYDQVPELPIVILSGFNDEDVAIKAVREGAQDYLIKGEIDGKLLARSIYYAIERKEAEKELMKTHNDLRKLISWHEVELKEKEEEIASLIKEHENAEVKLINAISNIKIEKLKFDFLIDQLPVGILVVDAVSGEPISKNKKFEELSSEFVEIPEILEVCPYKGFYPDGSPYKSEDWPLMRSIVMGEEIEDEKIIVLKNDGTKSVISNSSIPIKDDDGQIIIGMSIFSDIIED
ncbi:response regulator [Methanobacterium oryzae]|uniref:response regulator n=1 Tax=Methanobacterium oryzae TaxID=69540 RepID=UPI003D19A4FF